jgi:hypothetical protein
VIATPGGTLARLAVERLVRERGWSAATSPAEANVLVVAGPPVSELDTHIDRVWAAMPAPRVRADIGAAAEAPAALTAAVAHLADPARQRAEAAARRAVEPDEQAHGMSGGHEMSCGSAMPDMDHDEHDDHGHGHGHGQHDQHDMHDMHEGHEGHDMSGGHDMHGMHHGHDMSGMEMPGGVPMADRAADRDGLMLDVLHVPLGPALPDWPAGLVVHTTLQGDVVQEATIELLGHSTGHHAGHHAAEHGSWRDEVADPALVHRLDSAARLLAVVGWQDAATTARRLRDEAVTGSPKSDVDKWARRVRRSRTLRWSLAGVGEHEGTDTLGRLHAWLDGDDAVLPPDVLPRLLVGTEFAAARLIVAGLGLDPDQRNQRVHAHG